MPRRHFLHQGRSTATEQQPCDIPAEAPGEVRLRDSGRRAQGLETEFTDPEQTRFPSLRQHGGASGFGLHGPGAQGDLGGDAGPEAGHQAAVAIKG